MQLNTGIGVNKKLSLIEVKLQSESSLNST